jgi:uncharacterized protein (DUF2147 family)
MAIRMALVVTVSASAMLCQSSLAVDAPVDRSNTETYARETPEKRPADAVTGVWLTAGKDCRIEIKRSTSGKYDGRIVWLKEPYEPSENGEPSEPKRDINNPDESKRNQLLVGLALLKGFGYAGDNVWSGGTIYDPENGKTYKCQMKLTNPKRLDVRGYIGFRAFGRTTAWTRYEKPEKDSGHEGETSSQTNAPVPQPTHRE